MTGPDMICTVCRPSLLSGPGPLGVQARTKQATWCPGAAKPWQSQYRPISMSKIMAVSVTAFPAGDNGQLSKQSAAARPATPGGRRQDARPHQSRRVRRRRVRWRRRWHRAYRCRQRRCCCCRVRRSRLHGTWPKRWRGREARRGASQARHRVST
jgi:hypothetical protein